MRSGHWQRFWVGQRKGRDNAHFGDDVIVRWVPPVAVMGGGGSEVIHRASMPR